MRSEITTCELINLTGEILETKIKIYPTNSIDVGDYAAGVYFLKILTSGKEVRLKFIKE